MSTGKEADVAKNPTPTPVLDCTEVGCETTPDEDAIPVQLGDTKLSDQSPQLLPTNKTDATQPESTNTSAPKPALSNIFGFIENLAAQLPEKQTDTSKIQNASPEVRRTSDLLDTLQKALMKPPTQRPTIAVNPISTSSHLAEDKTHFPVGVTIENAVNVTKMCVRINKKSSKPHRSKTEQFHSIQEQDASTYVTFEGLGTSSGAMVNSPDGLVHTTQVVERTSNPTWNKHFDVRLPVELLRNVHKRFILKVWRKSGADAPQTRLSPTPFQDQIVGFVTINISLLLEGKDSINDWFNVTDLYGRCNGRIKVIVTPKESVERFRPSIDPKLGGSTGDSGEPEAAVDLEHNALLNQTLKRKFTELEDITKRLKARLVDVTDDADFKDLEDEFDTDLNTLPDEDEEGAERFNWVEAVKETTSETSPKGEYETKLEKASETETDKSTDVLNESTSSDQIGVAPTETVIANAMQDTLIEETNK